MNDINTLRQVILELHGCSSRHVSTVPVQQTSQGHTVWQGLIEVFDLINHPKADREFWGRGILGTDTELSPNVLVRAT